MAVGEFVATLPWYGRTAPLLAAWPIDVPADWLERVNRADDEQELESLRRSVQRGRPFGQPEWQKEIAKRLGLESAYRPTGRPRKVGRDQNVAPVCQYRTCPAFPVQNAPGMRPLGRRGRPVCQYRTCPAFLPLDQTPRAARPSSLSKPDLSRFPPPQRRLPDETPRAARPSSLSKPDLSRFPSLVPRAAREKWAAIKTAAPG